MEEKKNYYGWASEEQYEAVFDAIKKLVYYDDYETFMVSRDDNEIKIFLDDIEITLGIDEDSMRVYCDREMCTNEIDDISEIYFNCSKICDYVSKYDEDIDIEIQRCKLPF